jgi:hypothetical protein
MTRYSSLDFAIHGLEHGQLATALAEHKASGSRWFGPKLKEQRVWASDKDRESDSNRGSSYYELSETVV